MNDDGFQMVTSKKKRHKRPTSYAQLEASKTHQFTPEDVLDLQNKITDCKQKLQHYDQEFYWSKTQMKLRKCLSDYFGPVAQSSDKKNFISLICYGLGSFDESLSSRYQLALLLLILEEIDAFNHIHLQLTELYDPVFNEIDKHLLTKVFGFVVSSGNDQCFRSVACSTPCVKSMTLFYMPHCGKALFNNLLYSNWTTGKLESLVILGNSFKTIRLNTLDEKMKRFYSYISDSIKLMEEISLDFNCDLTNGFSDFSLQKFIINQEFSDEFINELNLEEASLNNDQKLIQKPIYDDSEEIF